MKTNIFTVALAIGICAAVGDALAQDANPPVKKPVTVAKKAAVKKTPHKKHIAKKATKRASATQSVVIVKLDPSDGSDLGGLLEAQAKKAKASGRKPFVEFYADWCGPCRALRSALNERDPQMMKAFAGTYIIQLNADAWGGNLGGTGFSVSQIPVFFAIDSGGKTTGRSIDGGAWGANTPDNMAPPLKEFFRN